MTTSLMMLHTRQGHPKKSNIPCIFLLVRCLIRLFSSSLRLIRMTLNKLKPSCPIMRINISIHTCKTQLLTNSNASNCRRILTKSINSKKLRGKNRNYFNRGRRTNRNMCLWRAWIEVWQTLYMSCKSRIKDRRESGLRD